MIDLHSHILPDIDDGARWLEDALDIARACVADGIEVIAATPHVRDDYPTDPETMERAVGSLRRALVDAGISLDVRKGAEVAISWLDRLSADDLRRLGLAGNPGYLLIEFPYHGWPVILPDWVQRLRRLGITAVLGHPERNGEVQGDPERLRPMVREGALVQVTAASVDGRLGRSARRTAFELIEGGIAHLLASDAHHAQIRAAGLSAAVEAIGDERLAGWLARELPLAIVTGAPLPARPDAQSQGGGL